MHEVFAIVDAIDHGHDSIDSLLSCVQVEIDRRPRCSPLFKDAFGKVKEWDVQGQYGFIEPFAWTPAVKDREVFVDISEISEENRSAVRKVPGVLKCIDKHLVMDFTGRWISFDVSYCEKNDSLVASCAAMPFDGRGFVMRGKTDVVTSFDPLSGRGSVGYYCGKTLDFTYDDVSRTIGGRISQGDIVEYSVRLSASGPMAAQMKVIAKEDSTSRHFLKNYIHDAEDRLAIAHNMIRRYS